MSFRKSSRTENSFQLPSQYVFMKVLGEGDFGKVIKCWKRDIKQMVAVKIPKDYDKESKNEVHLLERFTRLKFDQQNIVKFIDCFDTASGKAMVFEALDINMDIYAEKTKSAPMLLSDIRTIIKQLATAFNALKGIGVIHTDLKLNNIMMVNHQIRPFKVKLIDFGLAIPKSKARKGMRLQPIWLRAPEIILGLPFSEAIDMWSLGVVMAKMVCGSYLFTGNCEYEVLQCIVKLLGLPAQHLLCKGTMTKLYFTRTGSNNWELKTPLYHPNPTPPCYKGRDFQSLDDLKKLRLERRNKAEAVEREQCVELLKAMLTINPKKRITPQKILAHPFITQERPKNDAKPSAAAKRITIKSETNLKPKATEKMAVAGKGESVTHTKPQQSPILFWEFPVITLVESDRMSMEVNFSMGSRGEDMASRGDDFACESFPPAPNDNNNSNNIHIQLEHQTPSATIPSGVIMVRPAPAENTLQLEDVETAPRLQTYTVKTSETTSAEDEDSATTQPDDSNPSSVITAEDTLQLEDIEVDDHSAITQSNHCSPSLVVPPGVIMDRPTAAERTHRDQESAVSHQSGLNKTRNKKTSTPKDSTTCDDTGKQKKKKKNGVQRVFTWMRKTFGSHRIGIDNNM